MIQYGYIQGEFDIDTIVDAVWEFERTDKNGDIQQFLGVETSRDMSDENVIIIGSKNEMSKWLNKFQEDDE